MFWNPNQRTAMSLLWLNLKLHVSSDHRGTPIEATFKGDMIRRRGLYLWPYIGGDYYRHNYMGTYNYNAPCSSPLSTPYHGFRSNFC